jgi:hypothetical protein
MKHPSTQQFFEYWDEVRGSETAPARSAFEPGPVRHLLGDSFVLAYDHAGGFPFRVAGTRVCALLGRDIKGESFKTLWQASSRKEIEDLIGIVVEETIGTVAGATAMVNGMPLFLELLLLPFAVRPHTPASVTGILAPLTVPAVPDYGGVRDLELTSWRHVGHRPQSIGTRMLRKWSAARGFMVYEGLR